MQAPPTTIPDPLPHRLVLMSPRLSPPPVTLLTPVIKITCNPPPPPPWGPAPPTPTRDHNHAHARAPAVLDRIRHLRPRRVLQPHQPQKHQLALNGLVVPRIQQLLGARRPFLARPAP